MANSQQSPEAFYGSPIFIVLLLLILLLQMRERRVRWWTMILMPVVMLMLTGGAIYTELSSGPIAWLLIIAGFGAGAATGILVAAYMHVKVGQDGSMVMRGSVLAVGIWMAILLVKVYGKDIISGSGLLDVGLLTSVLLAMTLGMMIARRSFLYLRYMRLKKLPAH